MKNDEQSENSEDETDIYEFYRLLFEKSLKIKKVNKAALRKVNKLERERNS